MTALKRIMWCRVFHGWRASWRGGLIRSYCAACTHDNPPVPKGLR